jgi:hypothetical protein
MIIMEIEKFIEHRLGKRISDRNKKRLLKGSFKEVDSDKIIEGDNFMAYPLQKCSAFEVYQCYVDYFNYTIQQNEKVRIPVSAEWVNGYEKVRIPVSAEWVNG